MTNCEFSVIKYVPDIAKFEPVNIGIALLDKKNKKMHNKYITNFDAFFKRLGEEKIHGFERSFENYKPVVNVKSQDYLWKLHDSFHGSIFYSEPVMIDSDANEITLQRLYNKMISIPEQEKISEAIASIKYIKTKTRDYIRKLQFPEDAVHEKYKISGLIEFPQRRDFAFIKNKQLLNTIDVFNFTSSDIIDSVRLFLYDIMAIISSEKYPQNKPIIFGTSISKEYPISKSVMTSMDTFEKRKIPIILPSRQKEILQEIRERVG